ncbi:MAG TPA: ADOP family duplicated permease [Vicinamibacterales bacterium]|nr:ADOP family duplicated permease [Vicinamibacterales bacterium]
MALWRTLSSGLRRLFAGGAADQDLDDELRHYLALATEEGIRRGLTPEAAARAARVRMGSFEAAKTEVRLGGWEAIFGSIGQDLRVGLRRLVRAPAFTFTAVLSLAFGLGANTTLFSIANAVLLRPLPYRDASQLVLVWTDDARRGLHREATASSTILDWRARNRTLSAVAFFSTGRTAAMTNEPGGARARTRNALVSGNLFAVLGVGAFRGRVISEDDERNRAPVAVVSHAYWQRALGGAEDAVGRMLTIDDPSKGGTGQFEIVGVLPPGFFFPDKLTDIFLPATTYWRFARESQERFPSWARRWTAVGRLAPGASAESARDDLNHIGQQLASAFPGAPDDFPGFGTTVVPVLDTIAGANLRAALWLLLGAVALVLVVVCANVANLQLARGATRQRELAVHRALGASRWRIVRQLAVESAVLAGAGGIAGVAIAAWTTPLLANAVRAYVPRMDEVGFDGRVWLFAAVASIASGIVFGSVPALRASSQDAREALREGGRGTGTRKIRRSQGALVLAQCALALVLLAGAGLLAKSLRHVYAIDPGFDPSNVLTLRLEFPNDPPPSAEERTQTSVIAQSRARAREQAMTDLIARVSAIADVSAVAATDDLFVAGQGHASITIPGRSPNEGEAGELNDAVVTPGFFPLMRVPLQQGRLLTREDTQQKIRALWSSVVTDQSLEEKERRAIPEPVVVNHAFVTRFFPGINPIGRRFCIDPTNKTYWYEIVGVVGDMHRGGLERSSIPEYYGPYIPSSYGRADLLVRTSGAPERLAPTVRAEVIRAMPLVTIASISTAEAQLGDFLSQRRLETVLLAIMAGLALLLAAGGIFALTHYAVAERTREIGVRVALGATPGDVLRLLVAAGLRMPIAGIVIGLVVSAALTRVLAHELYDVAPTDPFTFIGVAAMLAAIAASACYLAARRAARANPLDALREG